jgi:hypothetical protein
VPKNATLAENWQLEKIVGNSRERSKGPKKEISVA